MPDYEYIMYPRKESIRFFEQAMRNHTRVDNIIRISEAYYEIHRDCLSTIKVFVSNYYALSEADYYEVIDEYPDIDCLITISDWNEVTDEAYILGKRHCVGVFKISDFMRAINEERPYTYTKPINRNNNGRFRV